MFYRSLGLLLALGNSVLFGMDGDSAALRKTSDADMEQLAVYPFKQEWKTLGELKALFPEENIYWLTEEEERENRNRDSVQMFAGETHFVAQQLSYLGGKLQRINFIPHILTESDRTLIEKNKVERPTYIEYDGFMVPHSRYVIVTRKLFYDAFANREIIVKIDFTSEYLQNT